MQYEKAIPLRRGIAFQHSADDQRFKCQALPDPLEADVAWNACSVDLCNV